MGEMLFVFAVLCQDGVDDGRRVEELVQRRQDAIVDGDARLHVECTRLHIEKRRAVSHDACRGHLYVACQQDSHQDSLKRREPTTMEVKVVHRAVSWAEGTRGEGCSEGEAAATDGSDGER